jgi:hypothetical protein
MSSRELQDTKRFMAFTPSRPCGDADADLYEQLPQFTVPLLLSHLSATAKSLLTSGLEGVPTQL